MYADSGRRTPLPGYMGFLPGYYSGNLHGASVRELITPEREKKLRLKTKRGRETRIPWDVHLAESRQTQRSQHPFQTESKDPFLPKQDRPWTPPISGYGGHFPGYASRNMHGKPWKDLISNEWAREGSPTGSPASSSTPQSPMSSGGRSADREHRVRPWRSVSRASAR